MNKIQRKPIYTHQYVSDNDINRIAPLFESAFGGVVRNRYSEPNREHLYNERKNFAAAQYANRVRVSNNMGVSPLMEDSKIFGEAFPNYTKLFEESALPGNIIGMGEVTNPMNGNQVAGGIWNNGYQRGSGDIPTYVFGLQGQIAMHCQGFDLLPTIAVDTPKILLQYVDTVYGGGTFDSAEFLPSYIEISNAGLKRSLLREKKLKRAVSKIIISNKTEAIEALFIFGSTIKSAVTVEILSTGTVSGTTYTKVNEKSVKEIVDKITSSAKGQIGFIVDGTGTTFEVAIDDVEHVGLDYASALRNNIAEAASNDNTIGGMSRAQQEKGSKHKLNVVVFDKQLEVVGLEINADTSNIQIKDMASIGINVLSYLYAGVQNQLIQSIDEAILNHLYALGATHAVNVWESQEINYSLYIGEPGTAEIDITTEAKYSEVKFEDMLGNDLKPRMNKIKNVLSSSLYENQMTFGERLYGRILLISEFIAQQNRIGAPDFLVAGGELCAFLKKQSKFQACPVGTTLGDAPELYYTGTIFNTISVYKNVKTDFDDPRILFGRRGDDTDTGAKFLAYDLASSRQTIAEGTMSDKIRVWSRFAIADIGFYPELNYYTGFFINKYGWG